MRAAAFALALLVAFTGHALAWGSEGHRIVAEIAEQYLEPETADQVRDLLALDNAATLAEVSTWADEIRAQRRETGRWHFTSTSRFIRRRERRQPTTPRAIAHAANLLGGWRKRVQQSPACARLNLRFGFPISRLGSHFADRRTLQGTKMAYGTRGCWSDEARHRVAPCSPLAAPP